MTAPYTHIISVDQLKQLQQSSVPIKIFDVSFELGNPDAADAMYAQKHIAGAVLAHLERDLSAGLPHSTTSRAVNGGRHPLPTREAVADWLTSVGMTNDMQAVIYDRNGVNYCARLWWMLKWVGHEGAAVLDGGLAAWEDSGGQTQSGRSGRITPSDPPFALKAHLRQLVTKEEVMGRLGQESQTLIDARGAPRYRGDMEPLDAAPGHIPGALNRPFGNNFDTKGMFKSSAQLRSDFQALLADRPPSSVLHYCGSGVSALANVLGMELAGFPPVGLYAGSWSEWSSTPGLPQERG